MATKSLQILGSLNATAVQFTEQDLTEEQKAQARENIGAPSLVDGKIPVEQLPDGIGTGDGNVNLTNYYTKGETDTALSGKADLVNGKVPLSQLPDNIGTGGSGGSGGLTEVFWEDVKDRPFYDTRVIARYSYSENPNPVSFDCAATGYSLYKISDLVLTKEEIFNADIIINGKNYEKYSQDNVLIETDQLLMVQYPNNGYAFCLCNTVGTCPFTFMGYSLSVDVPEVGIYRINALGAGMSDVSTIDIFVSGELKTLDPKYIADMYYDTRKIYHFDSSKTPNPRSFPVEAFGVNGYKVFDLTPTLEEFFDYKINVNRNNSITECTFENKQVQLSLEDGWMIQSDQGYTFGLCRSAGTFEADYQGIPLVFNVPETGIYFFYNVLPSNTTFEVNLGGELKQIDPKFIPADLDFNLDDYYTKSETYNKSEVDSKLQNTKVDLSNYYTKSEVDTAIDEKEVDWEDVTNKPIDEKTVSFTWDGNSVGKSAITIARIERAVDVMKFVRINDTPITNVDVVCGGQIHLNANGTIDTIDISPDMFGNISDNVWGIGFPYMLNVLATDTIEISGTTYTVYPGVYLLAVFNSDVASQAATYVSYCQIDGVKQLDPKFISLENYYTKQDVYTKNEVQDIHDTITARISTVEKEFNNYYTNSYIYNTYYTKSEINNNYYTKQDVYNKSEIDTTLNNYYTKTNTYTKAEVDKTVGEINQSIGEVNDAFDNYYNKNEVYTKSEIDDVINAIDYSDYYTKSDVYNKVEVDTTVEGINNELNNRYVKSEVYTKGEVDSTVESINNAIDDCYTKAEINDGYYTKSDVYTKTEVDSTVDGINSAIDNRYVKSDVYNKTEIDGKIETIDNAIANRYQKSEVYNKTEIDGKVEGINNAIDNRYTKADVYNKGEIDSTIETTVEGINGELNNRYKKSEVYNKSEVDAKVEDINEAIDNRYTKADVYTKTEVDSTVEGINNELNNRYKKSEVYTKNEVNSQITNVNNQFDNYYTKSNVYNKTEIDTKVGAINSDIAKRYTKDEVYNKTEADAKIATEITNVSNMFNSYYTKSDIDTLFGDVNSIINEINGIIGE